MPTDPQQQPPSAAPAQQCTHQTFRARCNVGRLTDIDGGPVTGYCTELQVTCADCGLPFRFLDVPSGVALKPRRPLASFDGLELRCGIAPSDAPRQVRELRFLVHLAGSYDGQTQPCQRCGILLTDNRNTMVAGGDDDEPGSWAEGGEVAISVGTNPTQLYALQGRALNDNETRCGEGGHA